MKFSGLIKVGVVLALAGSVSFAGAAEAAVDCAAPVDTVYGKVRGERMQGSEACVWRGIPFAAPPVGELRWASPEPHPGWAGVRDAAEWGAQCMQKGIMAAEGDMSDLEMSEDCLYLNVWRPEKDGRFPVMLWIHGGGYHGGSGMTPWYWGDRLAEQYNVVVVTTNYRLSIFGFFAHPALRDEDPNGATGGQGSLDQVAAIKWVHENIENFGGDPENVTIFGESAGGWSICTMVATPLNKGMFHRAIIESGGCIQSRSLEKGFDQAREAAQVLGCEFNDLQCLRATPAEQVLEEAAGSMTSGMDAMPHHDGHLLEDKPLEMIRAGNYNKVPFMAGFNRDEFAKALKLMPGYYYTLPGSYEKKLVKKMDMSKEDAATLAGLYPLTEFNNRPVEAYGRMLGADAALACPTYLGLLAAAEQQENAFLYRFDYDDYRFGKYMGAAHAMEIPFIFGNLDRMPATWFFNKRNIEPARELSDMIQAYVINFARTGDPNGPGLAEWPPLDPDDQTLMVFDKEVRTEPLGVQEERCSFWDEHAGDVGGFMSNFGDEK